MFRLNDRKIYNLLLFSIFIPLIFFPRLLITPDTCFKMSKSPSHISQQSFIYNWRKAISKVWHLQYRTLVKEIVKGKT